VLANDADPDGDPLSIASTPSALHRAVTVNSNGTLHYTPEANSNGTDAVTYNDGDGSFTSTAHVTVTLTSVNDAPVANADAYSAAKNGKLTVTGSGVLANDTDPDGGIHTASVVSEPLHGTLQLNADGTFTYTPNRNYTGIDSFTYRDSDGLLSPTANVTITVGGTQPANGHGGGVPDMTTDQAPAWNHAPDSLNDVFAALHHDHGFLLT
jgi:VCBS repeat-containing protein